MSALSKPISLKEQEIPGQSRLMVDVRELTAGYSKVPVIKNTNMKVYAGQIVAIIGPNGAGKSTFLKAVAGSIKPQSGSVVIDGENVAGLEAQEVVRRGLGFVPQLQDVFPSMTVSENLDLGGFLDRRERNRRREIVVDMFPSLKSMLHRHAKTLSGGERKALAIARAMMASPKVLLLDEPSAALSPTMVATVWQHIQALREGGLTVLIVEQKAKAVLELADWGYILVSGTNALDDEADKLLSRSDLGKLFLS